MTTPEEQAVLIHAGRRLLQIVDMLENGWSVEMTHHADHSGPKSGWDAAPKVYSVYFRKIDYAGTKVLFIGKGRDAELDKALMTAYDEARKLEAR